MADKKKGFDREKANRTIRGRTLSLMIVCGIVAFLPLIANLYKLQIIDHDIYEEQAVDNQTKETSVSAMRGTIYDRNMSILAVSASVETLFLDPNVMSVNDMDVDFIAGELEELTGVSEDDIKEMAADTSKRYKIVKRKIERQEADEIRAFIAENAIKGVGLEADSKRYYPYASLAAQVLGFVGTDNDGLDGVEKWYNDYLTGTAGKIITARSADDREMMYTFEKYYDAQDGESLVLTIDSSVQYFLEKNMSAAMEQYDVLNGAFGIIMDVNTGAILGMATLGSYDPNNFNEIYDEKAVEEMKALSGTELLAAQNAARYKQWRNRVVSDGYEPGSTFKVITLAAALETGAVTLDDQFYCSGSTTIMGRDDPLHCWRTQGHGSEDTAGALQNSCNVAFADIGIKLGADALYSYVEAFGLTEKTSVDLPGESTGIFFDYATLANPQNYSSLTSAAFGQTFKVTPIQLARAVCAVVNGGYLMEPYIVAEVLDEEGEIVEKTEPTKIRQVISEETSDTMCQLLESVVVEGTAKNAYLVGYRVGGKTGTSEKIDVYDEEGNLVEDKIVSFIGIAPADDPEYLCLVALDTPSTSTGTYISGGVMAAPTVRNVFSDVLPYLGIEAEYSPEEMELVDGTVPYLNDMTEADAKATLDAKGFSYKFVGSGPKVTDQIPGVGAKIPLSAQVVVYMGESKPTYMATVPNLMNMTVSEANSAIAGAGLYMKSEGAIRSDSGTIVVTQQSHEAGSEVELGTVVTVEFTDISIND